MIFTFGDTFNKPSSGGNNDFDVVTTVSNIKGNAIPTIYGHGYVMLKKVSGSTADILEVYIDGNTSAFYVSTVFYPLTFFFQNKIEFKGGNSNSIFMYQTILSSETIDNKYNITQGLTGITPVTLYGKGKVVISVGTIDLTLSFSVDGGNTVETPVFSSALFEISFTKSITFRVVSLSDNYYFRYIAYTEI